MKRLVPLLLFPLFTSCGEKAKDQAAEGEASKSMETELAEKKLERGSPVFIRAFKEERELELFIDNKATGKFELFRTYSVAGASGTLGPKLAEGDRQVPEGFYFSGAKDMNPNSSFHLSFNINYPNAYDRAHGRTGSFIMIHGSNVSIGCLAMTDEKIEEIYALCQAALEKGQPFFRVHVFPFRMTPERMEKAADSPHLPFWENLKMGYDHFEKNRVPPEVGVKDLEYVFE
jgi:murein L,D-transpeptidase YafK